MTLVLDSSELELLEDSVRILLSPSSAASPGQWCDSVIRSVSRLLGADLAMMVLPLDGAAVSYTKDFDMKTAADFSKLQPRLPWGVSIWERHCELGVWNRRMLYGAHLPQYYRSAYYNEYVVPVRAHDVIGLTVGLGQDARPEQLATLVSYHERVDGRKFGERGNQLLRLIRPAFEAGVRECLELQKRRWVFASALDGMPCGVLLSDLSGRTLHSNRSLEELLQRDSARLRLAVEMRRMVDSLAVIAGQREFGPPAVPTAVREIRTPATRYRIRGSIAEGALIGLEDPVVLIFLEDLSPDMPSCEELQERFELTRREAEVALLLSEGKSNKEVAFILKISFHTARHHAEQVLLKLGAKSRSEVGSLVLGLERAVR